MRSYILLSTLGLLNWGATSAYAVTFSGPREDIWDPIHRRADHKIHAQHLNLQHETLDCEDKQDKRDHLDSADPYTGINRGSSAYRSGLDGRQVHNADYGSSSPPDDAHPSSPPPAASPETTPAPAPPTHAAKKRELSKPVQSVAPKSGDGNISFIPRQVVALPETMTVSAATTQTTVTVHERESDNVEPPRPIQPKAPKGKDDNASFSSASTTVSPETISFSVNTAQITSAVQKREASDSVQPSGPTQSEGPKSGEGDSTSFSSSSTAASSETTSASVTLVQTELSAPEQSGAPDSADNISSSSTLTVTSLSPETTSASAAPVQTTDLTQKRQLLGNILPFGPIQSQGSSAGSSSSPTSTSPETAFASVTPFDVRPKKGYPTGRTGKAERVERRQIPTADRVWGRGQVSPQSVTSEVLSKVPRA